MGFAKPERLFFLLTAVETWTTLGKSTDTPTCLKMRCLFGRVPRPLNLLIELCSLEVVVVTEHTEWMLGKQLRGGGSFTRIAA